MYSYAPSYIVLPRYVVAIHALCFFFLTLFYQVSDERNPFSVV